MLEIDNLSHIYGAGGPNAHHAIEGLNLSVAAGELLCIVGPSGAGKSTLLRSIAGLITPSGGEVRIEGEVVRQTPDNLAVVFQDYSRSLFPWMSVEDNVALPLRRKKMDKRQRREAAQEALESVGLADAGRKYPFQLSGGMQQRVAIARALAYRPSLMLMDEPFGSVDAQTREDLEDLVLKVRGHHQMTIVLITHDIDESVYVGDRVVVLSKAPAHVVGDLKVDLPSPRDQITTREHPDFVHLRAEVGRLVRGHATADAPEDEQPETPETPETKPAKATAKPAKAKPTEDAAPTKDAEPTEAEDGEAKDGEPAEAEAKKPEPAVEPEPEAKKPEEPSDAQAKETEVKDAEEPADAQGAEAVEAEVKAAEPETAETKTAETGDTGEGDAKAAEPEAAKGDESNKPSKPRKPRRPRKKGKPGEAAA
uniref:ATP-binding cassette domain-containing protein n=1 Tax=Nonomuraea pusilla TaxID=46177 RepID=UPI000B017635